MQITFPFFGDILGFIGALGTGPTTFWLPSLMWLILKKPKPSNVRTPLPPLCQLDAWPLHRCMMRCHPSPGDVFCIMLCILLC